VNRGLGGSGKVGERSVGLLTLCDDNTVGGWLASAGERGGEWGGGSHWV